MSLIRRLVFLLLSAAVLALAGVGGVLVGPALRPASDTVVVTQIVEQTIVPVPTIAVDATLPSGSLLPPSAEIIAFQRLCYLEAHANDDLCWSVMSTVYHRAETGIMAPDNDWRSALLWGIDPDIDGRLQQFPQAVIPPSDGGVGCREQDRHTGRCPDDLVGGIMDVDLDHVLAYYEGARGPCDGYLFYWSVSPEVQEVPVLCEIYDERTDRTVYFFDEWEVR